MLELVVDWKFGIDHFAVARRARQQVGQAMVILRADDEIDGRRPADDLVAFGLGDAAGDGDADVAALVGRRLLQAPHAAELGIDLLCRLLADMAGIENDEIGVFGGRRFDVALRRQGVRHTL